MTWYGFQRIIEVDGEPTGDNYMAVTRIHAGGACAVAPEHGRTHGAKRNYISATTGFMPVEQIY